MARKIECPMCGHYNKRSQNFCPSCGTRVDKSAPSREVDESVETTPVSKATKRRNSALVFASIVYFVALFLAFIEMPVFDAGPITATPIMLALMFFAVIGNSTNLLSILVALLAIVAVVMTVTFLITSILNVIRYKKGQKTLFSQNVFYLVTIPTLYLLIVAMFGIIYDVIALALINVGVIVVLLTGIVTVIRLAILSVDKNRVSKKSIAVAIVATLCFVAIFACMFQPIFGVSISNGTASASGFDFSAEDLSRFYDSHFLANHYREIAEKGALKVISDAAKRLHTSSDKGTVLATIMMTILPATVPMTMLVSVVVIVISASAVFSSLLTKLCTLNEKKAYLLIAKAVLLVSSGTFVWSLAQMILAIIQLTHMLPSPSTLTFSVMAFPIIAVVSAIVMLVLNVKEKNFDYVVVNKY